MVRHQHLVRFRIVIQRTLVLHKLFFSPLFAVSAGERTECIFSRRSGRARQTPSRRRRLANRRIQKEPSSSVPLERADMVENAAVASATKTSKPTRSVNAAADDATSGPSGDSRPWWRNIKIPRVSLHDEPVWGVKVSKVRDDAREDFVCERTFAFSHLGGESRARRVARAMVIAMTRARGFTNDGLTNDARLARADV